MKKIKKSTKKDSKEKHVKNIKMPLKKKKKKGKIRPEKDIKIFLRNRSISYLSILEIIIQNTKNDF